MSAGKHTPGPWKVRENGGLMKAVEANKDWLVYACGRDYMGREELEANARLIAAAPELLEALQEILSTMRKPPSGSGGFHEFDIKAAERAIAKATGSKK